LDRHSEFGVQFLSFCEFEVSEIGESALRVRTEGGFGAVLAVERVPKGKVLAKIGEI
jgi:hypothetical protein